MKDFNKLMIEELGITDEDITYHKAQFNKIGTGYILQHPFLCEVRENADMKIGGDCYFCDNHDDNNLMCVFSRTDKEILAVCVNCFTKHNFINFNL